jgi:hypothetical protein
VVARWENRGKAGGEGDEVGFGEVACDHAVAVELALDALDFAVGAIVEDHGCDVDAVAGGGRELLNVVHEAAVAPDRDHAGERFFNRARGRLLFLIAAGVMVLSRLRGASMTVEGRINVSDGVGSATVSTISAARVPRLTRSLTDPFP